MAHKPDSSLVRTPVDSLCGDPKDRRGGPGVYDGVSGLPQRTSSPNAVPEKLQDTAGGLPAKKG
jgi:hypothetical protein